MLLATDWEWRLQHECKHFHCKCNLNKMQHKVNGLSQDCFFLLSHTVPFKKVTSGVMEDFVHFCHSLSSLWDVSQCSDFDLLRYLIRDMQSTASASVALFTYYIVISPWFVFWKSCKWQGLHITGQLNSTWQNYSSCCTCKDLLLFLSYRSVNWICFGPSVSWTKQEMWQHLKDIKYPLFYNWNNNWQIT